MPVVITSRKQGNKAKPSPVVIVLAVALAAAVAYIILGRDKPAAPDAQANAAAPTQAQTPSAPIQTDSVTSVPQPPKPDTQAPSTTGTSKPSSVPDAKVMTKVAESANPPADKAPETHEAAKVFDNEVENQLEAISKDGFESIESPRINMSDDEILVFLKKPVEIYDDDDEDTIAAKERTAAMKQEALKYLADGGTLNQFLRDYAAQVKEGQETVKDVRTEMRRILEAEGEEAARQYLDEMNPQLKAAGLKEVKLSGLIIKAVEKRKAKEAAAKQDN